MLQEVLVVLQEELQVGLQVGLELQELLVVLEVQELLEV